MKSRAAVLRGVGQDWKVLEIDIAPPKPGEVLVQWKAAGICHSDEHAITGDLIPPGVAPEEAWNGPDPIIGGHEGAGVVAEVGEGVTVVEPGDHVAASFVEACGHCRWCASGYQYLCDTAWVPSGDTTPRHTLDGAPLTVFSKLGTFAEHTVVPQLCLVKVDPHLSLTAAALVSCGVATGWGSSATRAGTRPGDIVVVVGVGGVGMNAVQGARMTSARYVIAVDPVEFKREKAMEFGATHTAASTAEAIPLVRELSWGQMAERVILTCDIIPGDLWPDAMELTSKGGTCVVTGASKASQTQITINMTQVALYNKEIKGCLYGAGNPRQAIPNLLELYRNGLLKLDELVTRTYPLEDINQGFQDMRDGKNIRGVLMFD